MHRRANKSKKVPNVRLRPAAADAMARARALTPEPTSYWAEDSQIVGSDDTIMLGGSCPRPFKGVVVCATGVLDKPALFKLALELGATSVSAFTDRVTHLVAEDHGGAKYMCALERKIPILLPSWIIDSHRIWQHGDDVDLEESMASHRLPLFSGITVCVSGVPSIVQRTQINKLISAHGGTYVKALERPVRVTHLLCAGDDVTDKMRYAEKFNRAGEADPPIQLVWEEWFWDCVEYGGRWDEDRYRVTGKRPERRRVEPEPPATNDEEDDTNNGTITDTADPDADEDELASIQRVPEVTLQLWGSLLRKRGYEIARGGVVLSPSKARELSAAGPEPDEGGLPRDGGGGGVLSSFRRANSFAVDPARTRTRSASVLPSRANSHSTPSNPPPAAGPSRLPFGRAHTSANLSHADNAPRLDANAPPPPPPPSISASTNPDPLPTVFRALTFLLRGETDTATVRGAIMGAGGSIVDDESDIDAVDYIIVRLVSGSALYLADPSPFARPKYRTECWLERCLFDDKLCAPDAHVSFVPIGVPLPIDGAEHVTLSFSGLEVSEACWVKRILKALGITLAPTFSRHTTHLLCPSGSGAKFAKAREWGVPVVGMGWLGAMVRGEGDGVPGVEDYLVSAAPDAGVDAGVEADAKKTSSKGKGKQKAEDTMGDITNSFDSQESQNHAQESAAFFLPPPPRPRTAPIASFGQPDVSLGGSARHGPVSASASMSAPPATPSPPNRQRGSTHTPAGTPLQFVVRPVPTQSSSHGSGVRRAVTMGAVPGSRDRSRTHSRIPAAGSHSRIPTGSHSRSRDSIPPSSARGPPSSMRIPSSSSPSPLRRGVSVSPAKIPDERTKALQESITSLLGKRGSAMLDDEQELQQPPGRKRGRAQRSKPQSRQPSIHPALADPAPDRALDGDVFGGGRSLSPGYAEGLSLGADEHEHEQSLQVMYEDPGQRAELQRLTSLIGDPEAEPEGLRRRTRKSARRGGV
ncbi:hypothetical protein C8J57DRAFT_1728118 [Mycena rebaudengoi]|nr:hypothetical protein C8J57DRAFT_1728118 [Mycena rebaudengoi]